MWKRVTSAVLLSLLSFWAIAQKANFEFYNAANGLSGNFTANVTQDDKGFIWVMNDYKLHRFDGRKFVRYPLSANRLLVSGKRLTSVVSYQDSLLLILSENEIFIMNPQTDDWQSYPYPEEVATREAFFLMGSQGADQLFFSLAENYTAFDVWRFRDSVFTLVMTF